MKDLLKYFKGYVRESLLGPLFKLLEASFELLVPILIATIVDQIIPEKDSTHLYIMVFLLVVLASFGAGVAIIAQYYSSRAAVGFTRQLTKDLYQKIMRLPKAQRDNLTASSLVTRLTSDTYQIQTGINQFLRLFLRAPIIVFGSIIMAFLISPSITLWFLLMVVVLTAIIYIMSRFVNPLYANIRRITDNIVSMTRQQLQGVRVIRAFGQTTKEIQEFQNINENYKTWQIKTGILSSLISPLTFFVVNSTLVIVIWYGNLAIGHGLLTQGKLVALVNYLLQILIELLKLAMLITSLNQSYISAGRIQEVFEQEGEDVLAELPIVYSVGDQSISAQNVTFTYPQAARPALENISFDLLSGQTLGVIGGTGAGKSTLVQLLAHLYEADAGQLAIFKNNRSPRNLKEWRSWISLVPQKAELFRGTIRSNLSLGLDGDMSDEQLWWALDIAQASDFVREKEGQLDAGVEAFGRNFSGGQRQRLTIARALIQKAPFLVLDDSTSALDYLTEAKLLQAIKEQLKNTSLILISQRTNSLCAADQILVLDKGHQVALGAHEDLLQTSAIYREIHLSQHSKEEKHENEVF
ncbi:ABC transporter ATP-binding protein [Streptococcus constellatus]|uniref:ABC transporter transmembrane region n=1 Tax=Streptococcus constellatus subsp. constellatus SK53 TaxID=1095730 RepID=A0AAD2SYA6_STRCV|nr:ABC transporter ATP-binding protein [Streptococcus constellatus]EID22813.1 ABC transporter transmembrane region [Streptococcus constellatus subsp. constellatus SK53]MDP1485316.1 ABC transporter ATP-binding protein [Streptococcus constellatus]QQT06022.1 ABC transporter ATP-binding protein [Streptococcus constellatus]SUN40601.1 multidrug ABC transporter [Streptococcus constellatus]BBD22677.1 putative ATP-binding/permease protein [Streptococcus constellatus subsp. constellatus]